MGLDSVELVLAWEDALGVTIEDAEAELLQTPRDVIQLFAVKLGVSDQRIGACLTHRAFHRVRRAIVKGAGVPRKEVTPRTLLKELFPPGEKARWRNLQHASGLPEWPQLGSGFLIWRPKTVADVCHWIVARFPKELKPPGERWTVAEIRTVVRTITTDQLGVRDFSDDAEFVRDLGLD